MNPLVLKLTGKKTPQTGLETKFSIYHASAAAIIRGSAGPNEFTDEMAQNPEIIALRDKVSAVADESVSEEEAFVSIRLDDGTVIDKHVEHAIGSIERPMIKEALEKKFSDQAIGTIPQDQIDRIMQLCWEIESLEDISVLARSSVPQT